MKTLAAAFTLIELSIVLVIIGLIVGGVLVGQDLIRTAGTRSQISQIERLNTAANTFRGKYDALPGDIGQPAASRFGFIARGAYTGQGDGNGVIESNTGCSINCNYGWVQGAGETIMYWADLSKAGLMEGSFTLASSTNLVSIAATGLSGYFPSAKISNGLYVYAYNPQAGYVSDVNYYGLSAVNAVGTINGCSYCIGSTLGLSVKQAFDMDKKIDDGIPRTGKVVALYCDANTFAGVGCSWATNAASPSSVTCFDTTSGNYSVTQNNGAGVNCALSFKMQ